MVKYWQFHMLLYMSIVILVVVQSPIRVRRFGNSWIAAHQASLSLTISVSLPRFMLLVMPSSHLILLTPSSPSALNLSEHQGLFSMSQLFASDDQNTGVSTSESVLPTSIQSWFPLKLTGLISLLSKGLSGVFSSTVVRRHQFYGVLLSLWSSSHNHMWPLGRPQPWLGPLLAE